MTGHGTLTNYVQGCRCDDCRRANAAYVRSYRQRNPAYRQRGKAQMKAYDVALRRLRDLHRDDFDLLYAEEKAASGNASEQTR